MGKWRAGFSSVVLQVSCPRTDPLRFEKTRGNVYLRFVVFDADDINNLLEAASS